MPSFCQNQGVIYQFMSTWAMISWEKQESICQRQKLPRQIDEFKWLGLRRFLIAVYWVFHHIWHPYTRKNYNWKFILLKVLSYTKKVYTIRKMKIFSFYKIESQWLTYKSIKSSSKCQREMADTRNGSPAPPGVKSKPEVTGMCAEHMSSTSAKCT